MASGRCGYLTGMTEPVLITTPDGGLAGDLGMPDEPVQPVGIVVFAHGCGSSRHSRRNQAVAATLREHGLATLLLDLLTAAEERVDARTGQLRFDIGLLAGRVSVGVEYVRSDTAGRRLPIGLFGASTGAAAALVAAAGNQEVGAVVSRGGRPDLAADALARVAAPTLLIVGSRDHQVIELNRQAAGRLTARHRIGIVQGAGHLFEEPGALEQVAGMAAGWFTEHLPATGQPS